MEKAMRRMALSVLRGPGDGEEGKGMCGRIEMDLGGKGKNCGHGANVWEVGLMEKKARTEEEAKHGIKRRHYGDTQISDSC
jgi:hypothetical protein